MHPNIWQPFTMLKGAQSPERVVRGDGIWLQLEDGRRIIDCISSWWVNLHGHAHPQIVRAISEQAAELEHVIFANFSHKPAEQLAERLCTHLPGGLNRLFYSDNGSTAVEVALKIAWMYWSNRGTPRSRFLAFEGGYHGDTLGAMSVGERSVFTQVFRDLLFQVDYHPYPERFMGDPDGEEREEEILNSLQKRLNEQPESWAGVIVEPLMQGAGGMRACSESFMRRLSDLCREADTLLIFDEVMTGFGRTGALFAADRCGVQPDLMTLSKGITGGFLPLAVTACTDKIYGEFHSDDPLRTLWHGHSYTANPLGCAAALASLDLLEENPEGYSRMESLHLELIAGLRKLDYVERVRVMGTIAAFTLHTEDGDGYLNPLSGKIKERCIEYGLLLRPLGNTVYLMPPYVIREDELRSVYTRLTELLEDVMGD